MSSTLSSDDVDRVAERILELVAERLVCRPVPAPTLLPVPPCVPHEVRMPKESKLAYTVGELGAELGVSKETIYRFISRGPLRPLPYIRRKIFTRQEVERFLAEGDARMQPLRRGRSR